MDIKLPSNARKQTINKTTYVYIDKPFWNPQRKRGEHKREYIGKMDNDVFIPNKLYRKQLEIEEMRKQKALSEGAADPTSSDNPSDSLSDSLSGSSSNKIKSPLLVLDRISEKYQVKQALCCLFPDHYQELLYLCYYIALEGAVTFDHFTNWAIQQNIPWQKERTMQDIEALLHSITPAIYDGYCQKISFVFKQADMIAYDITMEQDQRQVSTVSCSDSFFSPHFLLIVHRRFGIPVYLCGCENQTEINDRIRGIRIGRSDAQPVYSKITVYPDPYLESSAGENFLHKPLIESILQVIRKCKYFYTYQTSGHGISGYPYFFLSFIALQLTTILDIYCDLLLSKPSEQVIADLYRFDNKREASSSTLGPEDKKTDGFLRLIDNIAKI